MYYSADRWLAVQDPNDDRYHATSIYTDRDVDQQEPIGGQAGTVARVKVPSSPRETEGMV